MKTTVKFHNMISTPTEHHEHVSVKSHLGAQFSAVFDPQYGTRVFAAVPTARADRLADQLDASAAFNCISSGHVNGHQGPAHCT